MSTRRDWSYLQTTPGLEVSTFDFPWIIDTYMFKFSILWQIRNPVLFSVVKLTFGLAKSFQVAMLCIQIHFGRCEIFLTGEIFIHNNLGTVRNRFWKC